MSSDQPSFASIPWIDSAPEAQLDPSLFSDGAMGSKLADFSKISLGDLQLLVDLPRFQSLRSWASKNRISPIAASRLIMRVEDALGATLINRSAVGFTMTAAGDALVKKSSELLQSATGLAQVGALDPSAGFKHTLTFGTRGFLNVALAGQISQVVMRASSTEGIRFVDLSPDETVDGIRVGALDMVLSVGELSATKGWHGSQVGKVEWALFGRKHHPLVFSKSITHDLRNYRIGHHAYWNGKRVINNEGLELEASGQTRNGFGAETAFTALSIAAMTDQIVFVPRIAAKYWLDLNLVQELPIPLSRSTVLDAVLYVSESRVSKSLYVNVVRELKRLLL